MSRTVKHFLFAFPFALLLLLVHGQSQSGFISIDCGLLETSNYTDEKTGINFISDATFIDSGETKLIQPSDQLFTEKTYWSLRSFPEGIRNCYQINVTFGTKYLIRASFYYGNYDGKIKHQNSNYILDLICGM
ncbi:hypothetical protein M0R45_031182 [Rubus argutus]|uniref:Malectin-like domain-containing protein n=1 Tax=Rubus argutus TaxID=59490 RepID=A0AAW1WDQ3_RUBAR